MPNYTTNQCQICGKPFQVELRRRKQLCCSPECRLVLSSRQRKYSPEQRIEAFWSYVDRSNGPDSCWEWQASKDANGYGRFGWDNKRSHLAHRIAWELAHNRTPDLWVLHSCDNPSCCNPSHLRLGTPADNTHDMWLRGRASDLKGEENPRSKVTLEQVTEIRRLYADGGITQREIGLRFGITGRQVSAIVRRENWK